MFGGVFMGSWKVSRLCDAARCTGPQNLCPAGSQSRASAPIPLRISTFFISVLSSRLRWTFLTTPSLSASRLRCSTFSESNISTRLTACNFAIHRLVVEGRVVYTSCELFCNHNLMYEICGIVIDGDRCADRGKRFSAASRKPKADRPKSFGTS